jgi:membrane associated rhomboid family serine protease
MHEPGLTITLIIIILTCLVSYRAFNDGYFKARLLHRPYLEHKNKEYYRLLSHGFIHANWLHLGINMFVLWEFGQIVERTFIAVNGPTNGRIYYLLMYLAIIVLASVSTHFKHKDNSYYAALGASGATSGVLFAFIYYYPWAMLGLFFVIPCPAIIAGVLYLAYSSWASKNSNDNIGHEAHFYGAVFGFLFAVFLDPEQFPQFINQVLQGLPF